MMKLLLKDFFNKYNIVNNQLNYISIKSCLIAMTRHNMAKYGQEILFDEEKFLYLWNIYNILINKHFDINYNRKSDFILFFEKLISGCFYNEKVIFLALFCPGYTNTGYKNQLGNTTAWKLRELSEIKKTFESKHIAVDIISYYSDVFIENYNSNLNPNWREELEFNKELFHTEGEKYFTGNKIRDASEIKIFNGENNIEGYINEELVNRVFKKTYKVFKKNNDKFYKSMGFTEDDIEYRNDKLITMYLMLSDYMNNIKNIVFLPMENMYERENIFSENGTCTMYLRLKR